MLRWTHLRDSILIMALPVALYAQQSVPWHDPSSHAVQFVAVDKDVSLEVLDWGGLGRPVILLPGGGDTAHVFDEFAPKLTANYRVYGITRRGFGTSSYAPLKGGADRLGRDVLAVIRALKLNKPVLVGHSMAGAEVSSVATLDPKHIAGVVYLEAAYPYAFDNGKGPSMQAFQDISLPQFPSPVESDLRSFSALQMWDAHVYGFRLPESEFHQKWDSTPEGQVKKLHDFQGSQYVMTIYMGTKKYSKIPVPALAMFAIPHVPEAWIADSTDPNVHKAADAYFTNVDRLSEKQASAFEDGVPGARVIRLRSTHYIFISNERDVLTEMRAFIGGLK